MTRIIWLLFVMGLPAPGLALDCDQAAARRVQSNLHHMATWSWKDGRMEFRWGSIWYDKPDEDRRLALIQAAANADACLTGKAREIRFYSPSGALVGVASPSSGVRLIK